jgi:hypothetical protein
MKLNQQSQSAIETAIRSALESFAGNDGQQAFVTDIHIQPSAATGELCIYDDDDKELAECIVEQWTAYEGGDFYAEAERQLRSILHKLRDEEVLDKMNILKPYSFVLVDEEKESVAELLIIDDDTLLVDNELLKGLDQELDDFLKELLEKD